MRAVVVRPSNGNALEVLADYGGSSRHAKLTEDAWRTEYYADASYASMRLAHPTAFPTSLPEGIKSLKRDAGAVVEDLTKFGWVHNFYNRAALSTSATTYVGSTLYLSFRPDEFVAAIPNGFELRYQFLAYLRTDASTGKAWATIRETEIDGSLSQVDMTQFEVNTTSLFAPARVESAEISYDAFRTPLGQHRILEVALKVEKLTGGPNPNAILYHAALRRRLAPTP